MALRSGCGLHLWSGHVILHCHGEGHGNSRKQPRFPFLAVSLKNGLRFILSKEFKESIELADVLFCMDPGLLKRHIAPIALRVKIASFAAHNDIPDCF